MAVFIRAEQFGVHFISAVCRLGHGNRLCPNWDGLWREMETHGSSCLFRAVGVAAAFKSLTVENADERHCIGGRTG